VAAFGISSALNAEYVWHNKACHDSKTDHLDVILVTITIKAM